VVEQLRTDQTFVRKAPLDQFDALVRPYPSEAAAAKRRVNIGANDEIYVTLQFQPPEPAAINLISSPAALVAFIIRL
jgi:hypothetical protein